MSQLLLFPIPDWSALEEATATFEGDPTLATRQRLEITLLGFVQRADLLTAYVQWIGATPTEN